MRIVKILFFCHLAAIIFALGGLLIALPHPELWDSSPYAGEVFNFGIRYAGSLHILFGAATMLFFGLLFIGSKKTLIFFVAATTISLSMELLGTSTGFPFGAYSYTSFLGFKIADRVPYAIPLSWFYMGFTSFILANLIVARTKWRHRTACSLALGVYFLTVWDLALDPAMASQYLPLHFWVWHVTGPYFGMPIRNLVGWSVTGLIFMSVSRLLWRENLNIQRIATWLPFGVYAANIGFAIALDASAGLWLPPLMAVLLGILPASLVLRPRSSKQAHQASEGNTVARWISRFVMRQGSRALANRNATLVVERLEYLPRSGPTLLVARHFHHLYDGCALLQSMPRPIHILVALDWVQQRWLRGIMESACALAEWPVTLRSERLDSQSGRQAYSLDEAKGYSRRAVRESVHLLRNGEALVVFPEAYPTIDPTFTPKQDDASFLPFRPGFARIAALAERDEDTRVAIIPTGFVYTHTDKWHITLRFGPALFRDDYSDAAQLVQAVEQRVRELSAQRSESALVQTEEETIQL